MTRPDGTLQIDRSAIAEQLEQAHRREACLVVIGGLDVGKVIQLGETPVVLGRDPECEIVLSDDGISRRHTSVVRASESQVIVEDLGSTNGTFVAGRRVETAVLEDGDKILLGRRTILKFQLQDELERTYQRQMYESSTRDGLTGVFNRKYFAQRLGSEISFARRHLLPLTLVIFDIDHFKKFNDTHGHQTGDLVLSEVTGSVQKMIRAEDVLARYGGEEFVIIAQGIDVAGGKILGERVRQTVEQLQVPAPSGAGVLQVTVSVGVATIPAGLEVEPARLVKASDDNLYEAKRRGRNQVVAS